MASLFRFVIPKRLPIGLCGAWSIESVWLRWGIKPQSAPESSRGKDFGAVFGKRTSLSLQANLLNWKSPLSSQNRYPLLVHLTNIPTPYRIAFCNTLRQVLKDYGYGLYVLYCAEREPNRHWKIPFDEIDYPYEILPGVSLSLEKYNLHFNPIVVQRLRELHPQFVLAAGGWNIPTVLLASSRVLCGSSFRVFWNEGHADAVLHPAGPIAWLRRRCLRAYDAFAVPNESSASFVEKELGFRPIIFPLPNTVEDDFYRAARTMSKSHVRSRLGLPQDMTIFVSVTRLDEGKGVRELVEAMLQIQNEYRCCLVLVGEGPLRQELETYVRAHQLNIYFTGQQSQTRVRDYLAAADAFALASKRDPNPLAVIEAAFAGLPLLVSGKAGNVKELVRDGYSGFVIPEINSASIAAILARFYCLADPERRQLGIGATQLAESGFRRQDVVRSFVSTLLNCGGPCAT